jgi:chloride channel protein, CIC family
VSVFANVLKRDERAHVLVRRAARLAMRLLPTESQRLLVLTIAIGAACGLVAVMFHEAIRLGEEFSASWTGAEAGSAWPLWALLFPTLGGLGAGILLTFFFPNARGSGVPQVKASYSEKAGRVRLRDAAGKFFVSALQIGSGASLGREGPTVQICAGVASSMGRLLRLSPQAQRKLIPVGAAAGIAAAFNAPIAAVTFTIEEIIGKLDETLLSGVIIAAALAAVIERSILGTHPVFEVQGHYGLYEARSLLLYVALGIAAAFVSVGFNDLLLSLRRRFQNMRRVPPWARPAIGGLVTGGLAVGALMLTGTGGVAGGGYESLRLALSGDLRVEVLLVLCAAKVVATCFSYSSGGAGGIFAPVLFIGAMLGGAFGWLDVHLFHHVEQTTAAFALVGMGAMFSGAIRAPMTSVLIIVEMTSGYDLILPLMIANMSAYLLARKMRRPTIYEALLAQDGIKIDDRHLVDALERIELSTLITRDRELVTFETRTSAEEIARLSRLSTSQSLFPVLDVRGRLAGVLTAVELEILTSEPELLPMAIAADLMRPPISVNVRDPIRMAFALMQSEKVRELPVVDDEGAIVGFVDEGSLAHVYLAASGPSS